MPSIASRILGSLLKPFRGPSAARAAGSAAVRVVRVLRGRYDAATTTQENARHWANADGLSARAANSPDVRRKLRERSRYEAANNSYCRGIVSTLANHTVGTGPRLQLLTGDPELNRKVEVAFSEWCNAVRLAEKLRTMRAARVVDGEAFAMMVTNGRLTTPVQLDVRVIEADQVATPDLDPLDTAAVDGIELDACGNPAVYHVLRSHPGDAGVLSDGRAYDRVPVASVVHWFRPDRPGQYRGVPEITPALPLFAQLRRYTLAVLTAAETAADFAAVLESDVLPNAEVIEGEPFETLEIDRGLMMTLPSGQRLKQLAAEQPTTNYQMFKRELINEIARCLDMPFNIAAGNSSGYNYSSARLDHLNYRTSIRVDQSAGELVVLDPVFTAWLREAYAIDLVPEPPDRLEGWPRLWLWNGAEYVDPQNEATALSTLLADNATTLTDHYNRQGLDVEDQLRKRAAELNLMRELGIPSGVPGTPARAPSTSPTGGSNADDPTD